MSELKEVIVADLETAIRLISENKVGPVVSIGTPGGYNSSIIDAYPNKLRLEFQDLEDHMIKQPTPTELMMAGVRLHLLPPEKSHVQCLIDNAHRLMDQPGTLLVHCDMGCSQSPAAAYIILGIYLGVDNLGTMRAWEHVLKGSVHGRAILPNRRMLRFADELTEREHKFQAHVRIWASLQPVAKKRSIHFT